LNVDLEFTGPVSLHRTCIVAIVPVKPLDEGKSRLGTILSAVDRTDLNALLLAQTLDRVAIFPGAAQTIVISRSEGVLSYARGRGMIALAESGRTLNEALATATEATIAAGATGVLVVPTDLPLANAQALERIVASNPTPRACVLVPDRHGRGTNVLYATPPAAALYRFGEDSLRKHKAAAIDLGYDLSLIDDPRLSFDIDTPDDYTQWQTSLNRS
jgi:2-phospho-L-lactate guanylyltransferase